MVVGKNCVVIVADDYQFVDTVHAAGRAINYELLLATKRERVLELAAAQPLAMVLDLTMRGLDAIEIMRALSARRQPVKIVLLSGGDARVLATAQGLAESLHLEVIGTLPKPLTVDALARILNQHLPTVQDVTPAELKHALEERELLLHYQPKIVRSGRDWQVGGVEALVRWQHPKRGLLYPGQFLPTAESSGLIVELTDYVLEEGARQSGIWHQRGLGLIVALNLAPRLVRDVEFPERLLRVLELNNASPSELMVEVIEAHALEDRALLLDVFTRLRMHGVGLSLDDFGTGYSSLTELYKLPFNEIKIDSSLIHDLSHMPQASVIVSGIIDLAHRMSMRVCAEGVETPETLDFLVHAGVDAVQGMLISMSLPAGELETFVANWRPAGRLRAAG